MVAILSLIFILAISFGLTAGLVALVCFAFGLAFSWKIALGIWVIIIILRSIFSSK